MKVLQFSGGKDSLAVLFLKRPEWNDITVMWCNTGSVYHDTEVLMGRIAKLVPNFYEVQSDKASWSSANGVAVDITPERHTLLGKLLGGKGDAPLYTSYLRCCSANLWAPMADAVKKLGVKHVIRGQRTVDIRKAPILSGHVDSDGITYEFPIENWADDEVLTYCREVCPEYLPAYYENGEKTSHDCWDCVAYLDENEGRIKNLPYDKQKVVYKRLEAYWEALQPDLGALTNVYRRTA